MSSRRALIVDDSKTAQHLLKKMLEKFNLKIDTALSAEEALGYLTYKHPDVIFLDHQMTGMNGIQALKTIKANPHTALIPVVMYTANNDDLFVSQAVALGAQGIFSKGSMQPSNLEKVLKSLNIGVTESAYSNDAGSASTEDSADPEEVQPTAAMATVEEVAATEHPDSSHAEGPPPNRRRPTVVSRRDETLSALDQIRTQIGRLFEIHITAVRNQIDSNTQFLMKRLAASATEKNEVLARVAEEQLTSNIRAVVQSTVIEERNNSALAKGMVVAFFTFCIGMLGYLVLQNQYTIEELSRSINDVALAQQRSQTVIPEEPTPMLLSTDAGAEPAEFDKNASLLKALTWIQGADLEFGYAEQPLNSLQLSNLNTLVNLLADGGYRSPLIVNIHFGNFCLEPTSADDNASGWRLARDELPVTSCKMLKDLAPRFVVQDYMTVAYRNFERDTRPIQDGRISLQLITSGMNAPRIAYPIVRTSTTAGEWNRAALRNNRIEIQFPDNFPARQVGY